MRINFKKIAISCVVLALVMIPAGYFAIRSSDAFSESEKFIRTNPAIHRELGAIQRVSLALLGSQSYIYAGASSMARLELLVAGSSKTGTIILQLEKHSGEWKITDASLITDGGTRKIE